MLRFAVHRPAGGVASPRSHPRGFPPMPQGDAACRVHVGVRLTPAGPAAEDGVVLTRLPIPNPAGVTGLRRPRRVDLLAPAGGFLFQPGDKQPPAVSENAPVQPGFLPHMPARLLDRATGRTGHGPDRQRLHPNTATPQPHPPAPGNTHPGPATVHPPNIGGFHHDDPETHRPAAPPKRRPAMRTPEEVRHCRREITQRLLLLLNGLRPGRQPRTVAPRLGQLPGLLVVSRRRSTPRIPPRLLFHRRIPHIPRMPAMDFHHSRPLDGRIKPVTGHATILRQGRQPMGKTGRRFLPAVNGGVPTPQVR